MSGRDMRSYQQKAADNWPEVPDWVEALARYADTHGGKAAAVAIGYAQGVVSVVINASPHLAKFNVARIEQAVRGALMGLNVWCPGARDDIARSACLSNQKLSPLPSSSRRMRIYRACRSGCPHSSIKPNGGKDDR